MDLTDPRKKAIENNHRRKFPYLSEKVSWKHQFEQIFKIHRNSNIFTLPGRSCFMQLCGIIEEDAIW
jgi:hypothetical protein